MAKAKKGSYYRLREACEILGVSKSTMRRAIKKYKIPIYRYCSLVLIPKEYVDADGNMATAERGFKS